MSVIEMEEVSKTKDLFVTDHDEVKRIDAVSINEDKMYAVHIILDAQCLKWQEDPTIVSLCLTG
jgi:hypothetical protein